MSEQHDARHTGTGERPFLRRTHYFIEPRIQLRICALVVGCALVLAMILAGVVYWRFTAGNAAYIARYPDLAPALQAETSRAMRIVFGFGAVAALVFALPAVLVTIFYTHRLVGPLRKTVRYLRAVAADPEGSCAEPLRFRRGDWFPEIAEAVNELVAVAVRQRGGAPSAESSDRP